MSYMVPYAKQSCFTKPNQNYKEWNEPSLNILFEIRTLEWMEQNTSFQNKSRNQFNQYGIIWIKKGAGVLTVDLNHYEIKDNGILCFSQGQLIRFSNSNRLEGYLISFSADFLFLSETPMNASLLESFFHTPNVSVMYPEGEIQSEMEDIVNKMNKEFGSYCMLRSQILKGLLKVFIFYLSRNLDIVHQTNVTDRDTEMVRKFTALVKKHFLTKKMVVDYARELCISPNYLNRIVKKISGFTASHHIQQHIILEAKRQAIHSGLSMKEVAYLLGFNDYAHFSKFFKNNSGSNFTCFKNTIQ